LRGRKAFKPRYSKKKFGKEKLNFESLQTIPQRWKFYFYTEEGRDWLDDPLATNLKSVFADWKTGANSRFRMNGRI
jgi:hypothetical protein